MNPEAAKRVTRIIRPVELGELLERPPRAVLAFVADGAIEAIPVTARYESGRFLVGLPAGTEPPTGRVKLLIDDGPWYFDLRGAWTRGSLRERDQTPGVLPGYRWFDLDSEKTVAWHYGRMREE